MKIFDENVDKKDLWKCWWKGLTKKGNEKVVERNQLMNSVNENGRWKCLMKNVKDKTWWKCWWNGLM